MPAINPIILPPSDAPNTPIFDGNETDWLDALPAYNNNEGNDSLLDLSRLLVQSQKYYFYGFGFPNGDVSNLRVPALATQDGTFNIPPYSYLVNCSMYSTIGAGFKVNVYDKGAQQYLYQGQWIDARQVASEMQHDTLLPANYPFGPSFLQSPMIVMPPGLIQIRVVNLANEENLLQVMLAFAIPVTPTSTGRVNTNIMHQGPGV